MSFVVQLELVAVFQLSCLKSERQEIARGALTSHSYRALRGICSKRLRMISRGRCFGVKKEPPESETG